MDMYERCSSPERAYSAAAFWFLNDRLDANRMIDQMDDMARQGIYQAFLHPRAYLLTPYLEKEWWDVIGASIAHARDTGFLSWLYDEYAWPSGTAGSTFEFGFQKPSRVLAKGRENMAKSVRIAAKAEKDERILAVYYIPTDEKGALCLEKALLEKPTSGHYEQMFLLERAYPTAVDYLNPDTIRLFLDLTHEEYKKRFGDLFGKSIPGIFFDEIYMIGTPLPWTERLPERFEAQYGQSIYKTIPLLLAGNSPEAYKARQAYYTLVATMYEEAFFAQIGDWCKKNHLILTGHTEEFLLSHPRRQGHYFRTTRHLQMPGADCHDYRYKLPRTITLHEPKYAVSVARAYNAPRAMSEAMGGAGWGCSLQEFRRGVNVLGAMGISFFTLHGFYYDCEHQGSQADWPTSFFYQNPYWRYFKQFADYMRRVSYMNAIGRAVVECGLYYPLEQLYAHTRAGVPDDMGRDIDRFFEESLNTLIGNQIDTDMIDRDGIMRATCANGSLCVGSQRFHALILPAFLEEDVALFEVLSRFQRCGGQLFFARLSHDQIAPAPFCACPHVDIAQLPEAVRGAIGSDVCVLSQDRTQLFVNHRQSEEGEHYMIANGTDERRVVSLITRARGNVCLFSPETGKTYAAKAQDTPEGTILTLTLEADEALYALFNTKLYAQENRFPSLHAYMPVLGRWSFLPLPAQADVWSKESEINLPYARFADARISRIIRVCNTALERGNAGRHLSAWSAGWITRRPGWVDNSNATDMYFRKILTLPAAAEHARLCLAAVNHVSVYVNGQQVLKAHSGEQPLECDIRAWLRAGENLIAVHVHNDTPLSGANVAEAAQLPRGRMTSLLLEGDIVCGGKSVSLRSDETWSVAVCEHAGWNEPGTSFPVKISDAARCTGFINTRDYRTDDWLTAWNRGCPPLLPTGDLPLFGQSVNYPAQIAYTFTLPAGTTRILPPDLTGEYTLLVDGVAHEMNPDGLCLEMDGDTHLLTLQMQVENAWQGLHAPVRVRVAPHRVNLGDWYKEGLHAYSGYARYENTLTLSRLENKRYFLSLGDVRFCAEIYVNAKHAGTRIWAPYCVEVTDLLHEGENTFTIIVANSAACERRYMLVDEGEALGWNRYWNKDNIEREPKNLVSGLLGDVRLYQTEA